MTYEAIKDKTFPADWRVEAINHSGDGEVYVTIFTATDAETRAREYAKWKNESIRSK